MYPRPGDAGEDIHGVLVARVVRVRIGRDGPDCGQGKEKECPAVVHSALLSCAGRQYQPIFAYVAQRVRAVDQKPPVRIVAEAVVDVSR